jgi:hypothetical protein
MGMQDQFKRGSNKGRSNYNRPALKSQTAQGLWNYFNDIQDAYEQSPLLSDATTFENSIIALASDPDIDREDFIKTLSALSYALDGVAPTQHKKWELFQTFGKHLPDLDHRVQDHLRAATSRQTKDIAMAFKGLKTRPSGQAMMLIENQFLRHMQGATIFDISNVLNSMASLAYVPGDRFINAIAPRIEKRKKSVASKSENRQFTQTLQALATMQAISQSSGLSRPDIKPSALEILDFLKDPKTDTGLSQVAQIDTQFEFGLNSEGGKVNKTKSRKEKQLRKIFSALVEKMPDLSWRYTPNRILNVTHADVDYALSYDNGDTHIPILMELDGSNHFVFGTRPDESFGEVSWNGSTILNSSNILFEKKPKN